MLDLLIHTSDTVKYNKDRNLWTLEMVALDRASNMKQGYIQSVKPVRADGRMSRMIKDPKRFMHVYIEDHQWNPAWLGKLLDDDGEDIQDALWKFDIKKLLTQGEYNSLINIPFNDNRNRPAIIKRIVNPASLIELVDWNKEKNRVPLRLHGSAGDFIVTEEVGVDDYDSLKTAVEAEAADISGGSTDANFFIRESWDDPDTGNWDIDGWNMGTNVLLMQTQGAARHSGRGYQDTVHRIEHTSETFDIEEGNTIADGIMFKSTFIGIRVSGGQPGVVLKNCYGFQIADSNAGVYNLSTGTIDCINSVAYKIKAVETATEGWLVATTANIYNCVACGFNRGIEDDGGTVTATNCAVFNNNFDFFGTPTVDHCASDDEDGTNSVDISPGGTEATDWAAAVEGYADGDFKVKDTDSVLYNAGTDLSGSGVTDDIIGTARPQDSVYDIGVWELEAGAPPSILLRTLALTGVGK